MKKGDRIRLVVLCSIALLGILGRYAESYNAMPLQTRKGKFMRLTSPDFQHNRFIPDRFTCQGENISPALTWDRVPEGTKSFVLIVDDPDAPDPNAPKMTWVHWVVYNIPPEKRSLAAGESIPEEQLGVNDFQSKKQKQFGGPCPPIGQHRYFFKLYALDTMLDVRSAPTKDELSAAMKNHILASAELVGLYKKK